MPKGHIKHRCYWEILGTYATRSMKPERVAASWESSLFRSRNAANGVHAFVVLTQHHDDFITGLHAFG